MGYNRGGNRRTKRLKRHRREQRRLAAKVPGTTSPSAAQGAGAAKS
jgi:hypothetical protein